jgi:hypothetical protein
MLPGLECFRRPLVVKRVRRGNVHDIDVRIV